MIKRRAAVAILSIAFCAFLTIAIAYSAQIASVTIHYTGSIAGSSANVLCGQLSNGTYFSNGSYPSGASGSTIINDAISQVNSAGGGHVTIVNGTWILTNSLIALSNVDLTCYPNVVITENAPSALSNSLSLMETTSSISNFVVNGGTWNGNKGSLTDHRDTGTWNNYFDNYMGIAFFDGGTNVIVENLTVENVINAGVTTYQLTNAFISNVTVLNGGDNPITFNGNLNGNSDGSWNDTATNCTVIGGQDVGINTFHCDNSTLSYNKVSNVTQYSGASHWGIAAENSNNVNIIGNTISGCDYDLCTTSNNTYIAQNSVNGNGYSTAGIDIEYSNGTTLYNNTIENCGNYALTTYGVEYGTINLTIINLNVINCGKVNVPADGLIINGGSIPCPLHFEDSSLNSVIENVALNSISDCGTVSNNTFIANCSFSGSLSMPMSYNTTLQGNTGLSGYQTLNATVAGSGTGTIAESNANQSLSSINGNLWQFPTGSTVVLTAKASSQSSFNHFALTNSTTTTNNPITVVMNGNLGATAYFNSP